TLIFDVVLCGGIYLFIKKNNLFEYYGLCKPNFPAKKFLYYVPLFIMVASRLCFGVKMNYTILVTVLYILSMLCVGFLEEIIFRGFLFKALCKDNVKTAIIVSSITFGIGHIVNLFNGSGANLISNICQICFAMIFGFLVVTLFYRGKSLWSCIIVHGAYNAIGVFANRTLAVKYEILFIIVISMIACGYTLFLIKKLPRPE
ncbi:MAG: lysostaphin resistance A-like protein, partial [Cellulosilyticaceae bacterium]